jgi:hypothetical protein
MNEYKSYRFVEQKITHSGIFKLDKASTPIGIITLKPDDKSLSKIGRFVSYKPHIMRMMIGDLAAEITSYSYGPRNYNSLQNAMDKFERDLGGFLETWGFSGDDLNPHFKNLLEKAKKDLMRNLSKCEKKMTYYDKKEMRRRTKLVDYLRDIFNEYTKLSSNDINRYIARLLIKCGIETGTHKIVFNKIDRALYRDIKRKARLDKDLV